MSTAIKVASFNLKHDSPLCRGNRWEQRRDLVTQIIQQSGAAVIGVQEMMPAMKEDLRLRLEGYDFLGVGRTKKLTDEQSAILGPPGQCPGGIGAHLLVVQTSG